MINFRKKALLKTQKFTSSGTFTVPAGVYVIVVNGTAGGGGNGTQSAAYSSGGSGGYIVNYPISVIPGSTLTITIGAAGTISTTPTAGGTTSVYNGATELLTLLGGGPGVNSASPTGTGGTGGYPGGTGGFSYSGSGAAQAGESSWTKTPGSGNGPYINAPNIRSMATGEFYCGANSGGCTPFMYGRGASSGIPAIAGFLTFTWTE